VCYWYQTIARPNIVLCELFRTLFFIGLVLVSLRVSTREHSIAEQRMVMRVSTHNPLTFGARPTDQEHAGRDPHQQQLNRDQVGAMLPRHTGREYPIHAALAIITEA
jgi:hypothetical protein